MLVSALDSPGLWVSARSKWRKTTTSDFFGAFPPFLLFFFFLSQKQDLASAIVLAFIIIVLRVHSCSSVLVVSSHTSTALGYLQQLPIRGMVWYLGHLRSPVHHMPGQIYEGSRRCNHQPVLWHQLFQLAAPGAFPSLPVFSILVLITAHKTNNPLMATWAAAIFLLPYGSSLSASHAVLVVPTNKICSL